VNDDDLLSEKISSFTLLNQFKAKVLNDLVGQQPLTHFLKPLLGLARRQAVEADFQVFAHPHIADFGIVEGVQRGRNCFALGVENSFFWGSRRLLPTAWES
jgi:hypothetical protein